MVVILKHTLKLDVSFFSAMCAQTVSVVLFDCLAFLSY